jgi:hypothetical protein
VQPVTGNGQAGGLGAEADAKVGVMLACFTGNADRMGRRRNQHDASQRHKNAFFIIYSIQKIKIKEVPKKPENSTAHPSGINDLAK